jgi:hypothetical protein
MTHHHFVNRTIEHTYIPNLAFFNSQLHCQTRRQVKHPENTRPHKCARERESEIKRERVGESERERERERKRKRKREREWARERESERAR